MKELPITPEIAYITGFLIGDGNISDDYRIRAVEENEDYIGFFAEMFGKAFGKSPKIYFDKYNNSFVAYVYSKEIWEFLVTELEIPKGNKSRIVKIPSKIRDSAEKIKSAFLSGIFDAEGCVTKVKDSHHPRGYLKIQFKVVNRGLVEDVSGVLKDLGIGCKVYHYNGFSLVYILGKTQSKLFLEKVGFKHPKKHEKLINAFSPSSNGAGSLCQWQGESRSESESERATVTGIRPELRRSNPGQGDAGRKFSRGPDPHLVQTSRVTWG